MLPWILLTATAVEIAHPSSSTYYLRVCSLPEGSKGMEERRDVRGDSDRGVMTFLVGTEAALKSIPSKFLSVFGLDKFG